MGSVSSAEEKEKRERSVNRSILFNIETLKAGYETNIYIIARTRNKIVRKSESIQEYHRGHHITQAVHGNIEGHYLGG